LAWDPADLTIRASALVPARTLADVARSMGPYGPVTIAFGHSAQDGTSPIDGVISFEGGGRRLTARLIGAEFIKYKSRFPAGFDASAELPAAPFIEAVRRVSLVADRLTPVQLAFRRGVVMIEARSAGRARAVESLPVIFDGTEQMISFNPQYLLDGLQAAALSGHGRPSASGDPEGVMDAGSGRIRLQFSSPAKPALISWINGDAAGADDAAFRYLVVPLRVPVVG
jgi:DNA polymerase-3 subunit beta